MFRQYLHHSLAYMILVHSYSLAVGLFDATVHSYTQRVAHHSYRTRMAKQQQYLSWRYMCIYHVCGTQQLTR